MFVDILNILRWFDDYKVETLYKVTFGLFINKTLNDSARQHKQLLLLKKNCYFIHTGW